MRYLLGTTFFLLALALLVHARAHRRRMLGRFDAEVFEALRAEARAAPRSLASFGRLAQPFVMFALFYLGLKTTLAFVEHDGARTLSWYDLGGFLALLAGYGAWFTIRAAYALPQALVDRELERSLDEHIGRAGAGRDPASPAAGQRRGAARDRRERR